MQSKNRDTPSEGRAVRLGALLAVALVAASLEPVRAAPPELGLPIDCALGRTCWLVNMVDHDPGPGATDFRCGPQTYDTHKGVDFAIRDAAAKAVGVRVLAAAAGTVRATRDGMAESTREDLERTDRIAGRECGNGVVIDHADGWSTQYCHMLSGTISVKKGDRVRAGASLGLVGQSGRSEFPHVHMTLRHGDTVIDPFTGTSNIAACRPDTPVAGLWAPALRDALVYPGPQPYHLGFHTQAPDVRAVRAGRLNDTRFSTADPALVFWAEVFSLAQGDAVELVLSGPGGEVAKREVAIDRPLARWFGFIGKKRGPNAWPAGAYRGTVTVVRNGQSVRADMTAVLE